MTVGDLESRLSQKELIEWIAFKQFEPFGTAAEDWRFAKLISAQHGGHPLKHFPGYDAEEIAEVLEELKPPPPDIEEVKSRMMKFFKPPDAVQDGDD